MAARNRSIVEFDSDTEKRVRQACKLLSLETGAFLRLCVATTLRDLRELQEARMDRFFGNLIPRRIGKRWGDLACRVKALRKLELSKRDIDRYFDRAKKGRIKSVKAPTDKVDAAAELLRDFGLTRVDISDYRHQQVTPDELRIAFETKVTEFKELAHLERVGRRLVRMKKLDEATFDKACEDPQTLVSLVWRNGTEDDRQLIKQVFKVHFIEVDMHNFALMRRRAARSRNEPEVRVIYACPPTEAELVDKFSFVESRKRRRTATYIFEGV